MKHYNLGDFHKDNWHLYVEEPDKDFSPQKNYAVIQGTIKEYEKQRFGIDPKVQQVAGDRADILASWAKYKLDKGGGKQLEEWLGRERMAEIYGERLMEKIKILETIKKLNIKKGNSKFTDYYLT